MKDAKWRLYERIVAAFEAENAGGIEVSVTPNARLIGAISGVSRQIDVLLDQRWGDEKYERRIIVDAKARAAKVDIKDVEEFEGMMKDCRAHRGVLVCTSGYTEGAARRAQDRIEITILTQEQAEEFPWESSFEPCFGKCSQRGAGSNSFGLVLWDGQHPLAIGPGWAIVFTGKCDRCHNFHVWCWDCGEKFALEDESEHECGCERSWVTVAEEEVDPNGGFITAIHLIMLYEGQPVPLDRRRLT